MPSIDTSDLTHRFQADSANRALQLVGERWTMLILRETFFGVRRYGQFARNLSIPRPTLSSRLRKLVDSGLLDRVQYANGPDRFEYRLTDAGRESVRRDRRPDALGRHVPCRPRGPADRAHARRLREGHPATVDVRRLRRAGHGAQRDPSPWTGFPGGGASRPRRQRARRAQVIAVVDSFARTFDKPTQELREPRVAILYDAECQFCRLAMGMLLVWDRKGALAPVTLQEPAAERLLSGLTSEQRMETWHLVAATGERYGGGAAFAPLFELLPAGRPLARGAARFPAVAARVYDAVSRHRSQLAKLVPRRLHQLAARTLRNRTPSTDECRRLLRS